MVLLLFVHTVSSLMYLLVVHCLEHAAAEIVFPNVIFFVRRGALHAAHATLMSHSSGIGSLTKAPNSSI